MKLQQLDAAVTLEDMMIPPGNRLEVLAGDRKGQSSIKVNQQRLFMGSESLKFCASKLYDIFRQIIG